MLAYTSSWAQQLSDSYYRENPSWLDAELWATEGEYYLLTSPIAAPFEHFSLYGFSFVDYAPRGGVEPYALTSTLGVMELQNPLDRYPDYTLLSLLRRVPSEREYEYSVSHSSLSASPRTERFLTSPFTVEEGSRLRLGAATRTYLSTLGYSLAGRKGESWGYSLAVGGRWGRDTAVEGLFTSEEYLWLSGDWRKSLKEGLTSDLQVALMVAPTLRSQRSWNTEEVFRLAGNDQYNSYWGWQNGKVRSSRVRREVMPTLYASWSLRDEYILSDVNLSALLSGGRKSRSTLDWVGAPSPLPDYYGYLPSGISDPEVALRAESAWREQDERFTQIDWHSLYESNLLTPDNPHYLLMDERSDRLSAAVDLSAGLLGAEGGRVGLKGAWHTSREYNVARDLMGGAVMPDGLDLYDFDLLHRSWALYATLYGVHDWGRLSAAAEVGRESIGYDSAITSIQRSGDYFTTFRARICWDDRVSESAQMGAVASAYSSAPHYESLYGATQGAMRVNPYAERAPWSVSGEMWGRWSGERVSVNVATYASFSARESGVEHFWNDLTNQYVALLAGGLERLHAGVEIATQVDITSSLTLGAYGALNMYRYVGDGVGDIVEFDSGERVAESILLHTSGLTSSSSPEVVGALSLKYFTPRGWLLGAEWAVVGSRVVEPSLFLHSDYLLSHVEIPEEHEALKAQHSLGGASSLSLFVYRRMGEWTLSLSVRNLLNDTSSYRAGYQPSRVHIHESPYDNYYTPQGARYQHIYPRHAYLSVTYEF